MLRTWNTSWPSRLKIFGCSVVLQTRCRMVVFPALARPMIRTRKRLVSLWTSCARLRCLSISSSPWRLVLERDIRRQDAWDGGSGEETRWAVQCIVWLCWVSHRSDVTDSLQAVVFQLYLFQFPTFRFSVRTTLFPWLLPNWAFQASICPRWSWKHAGL